MQPIIMPITFLVTQAAGGHFYAGSRSNGAIEAATNNGAQDAYAEDPKRSAIQQVAVRCVNNKAGRCRASVFDLLELLIRDVWGML